MVTSMGDKKKVAEGLDAGADDFVVKPFDEGEMHSRLRVGARVMEMHREILRRADDLREALDHVKTLQGILPICMYCKKIRNDTRVWQRIEEYLAAHSGARFSHGVCDECLAKYHPDVKDQ